MSSLEGKPQRLASMKLLPYGNRKSKGNNKGREGGANGKAGNVQNTANKFDRYGKKKLQAAAGQRRGAAPVAPYSTRKPTVVRAKSKRGMGFLRRLRTQVGFGGLVRSEPHKPERADAVVEQASVSVRELAQGFGSATKERASTKSSTSYNSNSTTSSPSYPYVGSPTRKASTGRPSSKPIGGQAGDRVSVSALAARFGKVKSATTSLAPPQVKRSSPFRAKARRSPPTGARNVTVGELGQNTKRKQAQQRSERLVVKAIPKEIANFIQSNSSTITSLEDLAEVLERRSLLVR